MGFEPTIPRKRNNGFQDRRFRPLSHLSKTIFSLRNLPGLSRALLKESFLVFRHGEKRPQANGVAWEICVECSKRTAHLVRYS